MATYSSILAWRIPWTEEPGGLWFMGLGLDVLARSELWDLIRALKGTITIVLTTHYMEEAEALSDRVGIMKGGKLLLCETADRIKEIAGTDNFEQAFIQIVKGVAK